MKIDVLTLFPAMFAGPLDESIVKRARRAGLLDLRIHQLRDYAHDRHKTVDDRPFGGGPGMLLKPEPIFEAVENLAREEDADYSAVAGGPRRLARPSPGNWPGEELADGLRAIMKDLMSGCASSWRMMNCRLAIMF